MTEGSGWSRGGKAWDQEGVSPIIATILTVAIAVVLAGVVFYIAQGLTKGNYAAPPNLGVRQDQRTDQLYVVHAPQDQADAVRWEDLRAAIEGPATCTLLDPNGAPVVSGSQLGTGEVQPGQNLRVTGLPGTTCILTLIYAPGEQVVGSWTYNL